MITLRPLTTKKNLITKTLRLLATSVEPVGKQTEYTYDKEIKEFETLTNITKRTREKKPQRGPFVKNLMVGVFDTEILTYPQLEKDEVNNLLGNINNIESLLNQKHMIGVDSLSNTNFRQNLSDVRSIGLQAPQLSDGLASTPLEVIKYLETFAEHKLGDSIIHHEQLSVQTLVKYGSDLLQKKYLFPVMKGEKLLAFCLMEDKISNIESMNTAAELSPDGKNWILNGKKSYVINGLSADYYIVFAVTKTLKLHGEVQVSITGFVVDKDVSGVSWSSIESDRCEIAEVEFQNVQVPTENVIGEVNKGELIVNSIVSDFRLTCGAASTTLTKKLLNKFLQNILDESTDQNVLYKTELVRDTLGKIALHLYAAESVTYLTAGLQDWYDNQDTTVESAIAKVVSSEAAYQASSVCLNAVGLSATTTNHWARQYHNKAIDYLTLYETNESLRLFIALMGLQHAGVEISGKIKKIRNPLYNGTFILKRMWTNRKNVSDEPNLDLGLDGYLHPSLVSSSQALEYCVKRLEFGTERILARYGLEVINKHVDLKRLADVMIDCYTMTAVLGRASRSYCIGLRNSEYEMLLASAYCELAKERVKKNVLSLYSFYEKNNDKNIYDIGKQITKVGKYIAESPLTRNF